MREKLQRQRQAEGKAPHPGGHSGSARPAPHKGPSTLSELDRELRKGLGGAVERWIKARSAVVGLEDPAFASEVMRVAKLIAFEACGVQREQEGEEAFVQHPSAEGCETLTRETTTTRFRVVHPEVKTPFVFEVRLRPPRGKRAPAARAACCADHARWVFHARAPGLTARGAGQATRHQFGGEVLGTGKRLDGLTFKIEMELVGFLLLSFDTQSYACAEELDSAYLNQLRQALDTKLQPAELAVLLMLAGNAFRGANGWNDVEEVCLWSPNLTLPEMRVR